MPNNWRFRTNLRGRLILQRQVPALVLGWDLKPTDNKLWADAGEEDLPEFYAALKEQANGS